MLQKSIIIATLIFLRNLANAEAPEIQDTARGQLLYSTHCSSCHNAKVHWRDKKLATDWTTLQMEVHRWAELSKREWSDGDVVEVSQYLNNVFYHYPIPGCIDKKC